jgi:hypothetical protein
MSDFTQSLYNGEAAQQEIPVASSSLVDKANFVFGFNSLVQLAYGAQIYMWYPMWVDDNDSLFPMDISGTCAHDNSWAHGTHEITAWTNASYWYMLAYGWATFSWAANTFTDYEGGLFHQIFYYTSLVITIAPIITTLMALKVWTSYAATQSRYLVDIASNTSESNPCKQAWLYDDNETDVNSYKFKTNSTKARILYMFFTAIFSLFSSVYTMEQIKSDWSRAREFYLANQPVEEEEPTESEDAAAADEAAADEFEVAEPAF